MTDQTQEQAFHEFRAFTESLRQDFTAVIERHLATAGELCDANLVAFILIELGTRLSMSAQDPREGAKLARNHIEAIIAVCEAELQGEVPH